MKKLSSYILLLCFVLQSTAQVWIVTSFYIQRDYIANNLCENRFEPIPICQGHCYLTKQLKENEKQEQKFPDIKLKEIMLYIQSVSSFQSRIIITKLTDKVLVFDENSTPLEVITSIFHPPQIS